jgi:3-dehydroquinate synthase II
MTELWLNLDEKLPQEEKIILLEKAAELCKGAVVSPSDTQLARDLNLKKIVSEKGGNIQLIDSDYLSREPITGDVAIFIPIRDRGDEVKAVKAAEKGVQNILVTCPNWKIIPLENLIAQLHGRSSKLFAQASNAEEAKVAAETLELGVDGLILNTNDLKVLQEVSRELSEEGGVIKIVEAEVIDIKTLTPGARVCIDTVTLMKPGEGLLVGSQSSGLFLVQAEVIPNPHVEPRPFRVNAGSVSSYILAPEEKTKYLSELKAGDGVLIVDRKGKCTQTSIGRAKIELRPLLLVQAAHKEEVYTVILQNAETIHFVTKDASISVSDLKTGDKVLIRHQPGGRHFGTLVEAETVIER